MNFVIIANAWAAGIDNPTSKHQIALELARQGHRVLWLEGAGMRRPSLGSGADRGRIARKVFGSLRGPRKVWGGEFDDSGIRDSESGGDSRFESPNHRIIDPSNHRPTLPPSPLLQHSNTPIPSSSGSIHVLSPLLIPLPHIRWVRRFNGALYRTLARFWCWRLGLRNAVLINYVPVLCEAMRRGSSKCKVQSAKCKVQSSECKVQSAKFKVQSPEFKVQRSTFNVHRAEGGGQGAEGRVQRAVCSGEAKNKESGACAPSTLNSCTLNSSHVVYHCVDRWDKFDMYDSTTMTECDRLCCEYADVVIASSRDLLEHCLSLNANTHLVHHGVNWEHFAAPLSSKCKVHSAKCIVPPNPPILLPPESTNQRIPESSPSSLPHVHTRTLPHSITYSPRPPDLPSGPLVGFFGLLSEWVDQDLLVKLARELRGQGTGKQADSEHRADEPNTPPLQYSDPAPLLTLNSCTLNSCTLNSCTLNSCTLASCTPSPHTPTLPDSHTPISPSIVLIGKADVSIDRLRAEPNIHILGSRPFADLPAYVAAFDVGIIPFVVNELTSAVNPIKLREMLAAGCPVVSTALPEVARYVGQEGMEYWSDGVMGKEAYSDHPTLQHSITPLLHSPIVVAHGADEFITAVKGRLEHPLRFDQRQAISKLMQAETWEAKVGEILGLIAGTRTAPQND